jgi:hypothetical protein
MAEVLGLYDLRQGQASLALVLDTRNACLQPQRGGLAKPRPTAWVRKFAVFSVRKP